MAYRVCVIGAGPAGMTAAAVSARNGFQTILIEHGERVGRKLLLTGNGKCNFANRRTDPSCYHAGTDGFVDRALSLFGQEDAVEWLRTLGIEPLEKHGGYLYPHSEQASSVLNALRAELDQSGVRVQTACTVKRITRRTDGVFRVQTDIEMVAADRLILAAGSKAAPSTGSDGSGYDLAKSLGHRIIQPLPALCALYCAEKEFFKAVAGVRVTGEIRLLLDGREEDSASGELQLNASGLSGIPTFQVSSRAGRALSLGRRVEAAVNFLPDYDNLAAFLRERAAAGRYRTLEALGNGLLNKNLWIAIVKRADLKPGADPEKLLSVEYQQLADAVQKGKYRIIRTAGYEQAQTCSGGVDTAEVNPETMESRLVPGLRFAGEILDVDGLCGGYNLQWCWTSGHLAGGA